MKIFWAALSCAALAACTGQATDVIPAGASAPGTLNVRVAHPSTGEPLPGAHVLLYAEDNVTIVQQAVTNDAGIAVLNTDVSRATLGFAYQDVTVDNRPWVIDTVMNVSLADVRWVAFGSNLSTPSSSDDPVEERYSLNIFSPHDAPEPIVAHPGHQAFDHPSAVLQVDIPLGTFGQDDGAESVLVQHENPGSGIAYQFMLDYQPEDGDAYAIDLNRLSSSVPWAERNGRPVIQVDVTSRRGGSFFPLGEVPRDEDNPPSAGVIEVMDEFPGPLTYNGVYFEFMDDGFELDFHTLREDAPLSSWEIHLTPVRIKAVSVEQNARLRIDLQGSDPRLNSLRTRLEDEAGNLWFIFGPPDLTEFDLPELPEEADAVFDRDNSASQPLDVGVRVLGLSAFARYEDYADAIVGSALGAASSEVTGHEVFVSVNTGETKAAHVAKRTWRPTIALQR